MNLKEAFRYQNFLDGLMSNVRAAMSMSSNLLMEERVHLRSKTNSAAQDESETVEVVDQVDPVKCVDLAQRIITERDKLTRAINIAKGSLAGNVGDMDAAIEANKYRQAVAQQIRSMLRVKAGKRVERGTGYTFNAEGNQVPYYYDVEVTTQERFDRTKMKQIMQSLLKEADKVSLQIDEAVVNTSVDYKAPWDINSSFEDVLAEL